MSAGSQRDIVLLRAIVCAITCFDDTVRTHHRVTLFVFEPLAIKHSWFNRFVDMNNDVCCAHHIRRTFALLGLRQKSPVAHTERRVWCWPPGQTGIMLITMNHYLLPLVQSPRPAAAAVLAAVSSARQCQSVCTSAMRSVNEHHRYGCKATPNTPDEVKKVLHHVC